MRALSIGATGMLAQQMNVEVISNNIANMNTTGFKRGRAEFNDLLYQDLRRVGSASSDAGTIVPSGVQVGLGVKAAAVYRITDQGNITITDNSLDLAINGRGYFEVQLPTGETAYTRAGSFQLSPTGDLVTPDGYLVMPGITIPPQTTSISINNNGEVFVQTGSAVKATRVGQLELAQFPNEAGLEAVGDNLFLETTASGTPLAGVPGKDGFGAILQGALETSNVNVVSEITNLITAQRAYEMNSKVIQAADEMMQNINQLR
ncbi:flagellar basal-body rod protein FlgG [Tistlia consotensis]|uniref:Flagellar basal-body rod protein FlgG n=1 Tax=Tistlia consotensis USBA 355 TaxID=560819 RepID=A0A1Y6CPR0_9PROT|nr:flagellar basal-body rod protein FlgG [Tistlia consotensis]SMF67955.1 flagellar basal-body rod protein FlgG [Tistlia consotensis USBA 355]SNR99284.1 flagellar basal-body rod protein FlgG [Tistlia consotensis]